MKCLKLFIAVKLAFVATILSIRAHAELRPVSVFDWQSQRLFLASTQVPKVFFPDPEQPFHVLSKTELRLLSCEAQRGHSVEEAAWDGYRARHTLSEFPLSKPDSNGILCRVIAGRLSLDPFGLTSEGNPSPKSLQQRFGSEQSVKMTLCNGGFAGAGVVMLEALDVHLYGQDSKKNLKGNAYWVAKALTSIVAPIILCHINTSSAYPDLLHLESLSHAQDLRIYARQSLKLFDSSAYLTWSPGLMKSPDWRDLQSYNTLLISVAKAFNQSQANHSVLPSNRVDTPFTEKGYQKLLYWATLLHKALRQRGENSMLTSLTYNEVQQVMEKRCDIEALWEKDDLVTLDYCHNLSELPLKEQVRLLDGLDKLYPVEVQKLADLANEERTLLMCEADAYKTCLLEAFDDDQTLRSEDAMLSCETYCTKPTESVFSMRPGTLFCGQFRLKECLKSNEVNSCFQSSCLERKAPLLYEPRF